MKAALAGILILIGLSCVVVSYYFIGKAPVATADIEKEYDEISQLVTAVHPTPAQKKMNEEAKKKLEAQRAELAARQEKAASELAGYHFRKSLLWYVGMGCTLLGVGVQVWDWTSKKS